MFWFPADNKNYFQNCRGQKCTNRGPPPFRVRFGIFDNWPKPDPTLTTKTHLDPNRPEATIFSRIYSHFLFESWERFFIRKSFFFFMSSILLYKTSGRFHHEWGKGSDRVWQWGGLFEKKKNVFCVILFMNGVKVTEARWHLPPLTMSSGYGSEIFPIFQISRNFS